MLWKRYKKTASLSLLVIASSFLACGIALKIQKKFHTPYVTIIGPIEMADGIARQTAELAEVLMKDFDVNIVSNHIVKTDLSKSILNLLKTKNRRLGKIVIFEESLWGPSCDIARILNTTTNDQQIRIAYSMLESTRIPIEWVMQLNLYYDAVAVPDPFLIEVYQKSGVNIPIFELPLGVNISQFLNRPLKKARNPVMRFANLSSALDRKNQVLLIQAFAKALGNAKDAELYINCRAGDVETKAAIEEEIVKQNCTNIFFTEFKLKRDAYLKFFESVDCYVSLSKGEGFSIQPREAMALGIPAIVSNNTGQMTICQSGLVKIVETPILEPAKYLEKFRAGHKFTCTVDDAAKAIQDVYLKYDDYLQKGKEARKWASSYNFGNEKLCNLYKTLVGPKKILLGKENKLDQDYLMTNSQELYEKYQRLSIPAKSAESSKKP